MPNEPNPINVKGFILCATCDSQAKCFFMRFKQWNGYYGCPRCKCPGVRINLANNNNPLSGVQVYPYTRNLILRTNEEVPHYARLARQTGHSVYGVKGPTLLYKMMPNMVLGSAIDKMHAVDIGACKLLTHLWFDKAFSDYDFSLSGLVEVVDQRLSKMKPPSFTQRVLRSSSKHLAFWKAQEFKMWLMYYAIPVLSGIMDEIYLNHLMKLVSALFLLDQESVSPDQIDAASLLLHEFVSNFADLYDIRFMSLNIHLLLHLPDVVRSLGPLWVYCCGPLEDLNGKLGSLIHGTRHAGLQVCAGASAYMNLTIMVDRLPDGSPVRIFCENLTAFGLPLKKTENILPKMDVIGKYRHARVVPAQVRLALRSCLNLAGVHVLFFQKFRKKGVMYCSEEYTRSALRQSSYVVFVENGFPKFCKINFFVRWSDCQCVSSACRCLPAHFLCIATKYRREMWFGQTVENVRLSYMSLVSQTHSVVAFPVRDLECLCFHIKVNHDEYLAQPINRLEVE